jgi:hypothetical protein
VVKATARRTWNWLASPSATRVISIGMVLYLMALGGLYRQQATIVECQAKYAEASSASTQARTLAAAEDREVLDGLINAIATATSREQTRLALENYRKTRLATDEKRRAHPLPEPPSRTC